MNKELLKKTITVLLFLTIITILIFNFSKIDNYFINNIQAMKEDTIKKDTIKKDVNDEIETFKIVKKGNAYYVNDTIIVNKQYGLNEDYTYLDNEELYNKATNNFEKLKSDASKNGLVISCRSRYRDYYSQKYIYEKNKKKSQSTADTFSAKPGYSEHQTGLAFDVINSDSTKSLKTSFQYTKEYKWLKDNAYKYGFILRYPKGKTDITGYIFEPWHYRYVGEELSKKIYESGLTLEEYFGIN